MNNTIEYKGYVGSVEFSEEDDLFFVKFLGIRDFHSAVDDYLDSCAAQEGEPEKAYKGSFNVRISPELHRQAAMTAAARQMSLNSFIEDSIKQAIRHVPLLEQRRY